MNKQLLSILSLVFSLVLALAIYLYFDQIEDKNLRPINIVPDNYAVILESNASRVHLKTLSSLDFMDKLLMHEKVAKLMNEIYYYDSLIKTNETIYNWFSQGQATYSFHQLPNNEMAFFMSVQTLREVNEADVLAFFQTNFPERFKFTKRKFLQENIYDFTDFKSQTFFSIAFKSKLMLFSVNGNLVENALLKINKLNNEVVKEDKLYFVKNSGDGLNLHINYEHLAALLNTTIPNDSAAKFEILEHFAQRVVYNISLDDEEILLKGAAQTHETNFEFLDLLHAQAPIENTLRNILPERIHFAYTLGYNGYESFAKNVKEYLHNKNLHQVYQGYVDSLETAINMPFARQLKENLGNHAGLFVLDEPGLSKDSSFVIAIEATNEESFAELLRNLQARFMFVDSLNVKNDTTQSPYLKTPLAGIFKYYYTDLLSPYSVNYYLQKGKYFFFTNNTYALQSLQNRWNKDQFLFKNKSYKSFEKKLSPNSNLELYIEPAHATKYALHYVNNQWFSLLNQNLGLIKKASRVGIQFAGSNDKIFASQMYVQLNTSKTEKTEQVWAVQLDSALLNVPQVVMNYTLGMQVILAQDKGNTLYALDREGLILWRKKIDGEIISSITELDLFGNGKRQWLFNTVHQVYVIHDNGENCQGWPAWIPTGTKYPVSLFDPNEDRNYQIFAAGQYYKITAFNAQGRPLTYWNPKEIWPNIKSSIGQFYFGGNQIYWYLDEAGTVQFMNRDAKRNNQIALDSLHKFTQVSITSLDTASFILRGLDSNQLVKIKYTTTKKPTVTVQAAPGFSKFEVLQDANYKPAYFFQNQTQVVLQNDRGEALFKKNLVEPNIGEAHYQWIGESNKFIYLNKVNNNLYVYQLNGKEYAPFPIKTSGKYAIGNLFNEGDHWLIFSDSENKLNLFKVK